MKYCSKCKADLNQPGQNYRTLGNNHYCVGCLKCSFCQKGLTSGCYTSPNKPGIIACSECESELQSLPGYDPNSNLTCEKCKKQIAKGEKWKSETFPDSFKPYTAYYHEACFKQTKCSKCSNSRLENDTLCFDCRILENNMENQPSAPNRNWNKCPECGTTFEGDAVSGALCDSCYVKVEHGNNDNSHRERESKINDLNLINALNVANGLIL